MIKKIQFDYTSKTIPLRHQIDGIEYIKKNDIIPLFDEQGLGKSKMVIDALCSNIEDKKIDGAIIVCKKSLLTTWKNEILKHSHLFPVIFKGTKSTRGRSLLTFGHFYIVNYETLIQDLDLITLLLKHKNFAVVLDESQRIKSPDAKTTKAVLTLRNLTKKKIIITGTPIANKPEDIWSQFFFLDDGKLLGNDFNEFRKKYNVKLKGKESLDIYHDSLSDLREKIDRISIRRTKDVLELPEKKYEDILVDLTQKQRKIYDIAKGELYYEIKEEDGSRIIDHIDNYLVKLLRLTQIASNPSLIIEDYVEDPVKFVKLDEIVKNILDRNEKVIIWTSFRKNIRTLKNRYKDFGALMIFGEIAIEDRDIAINKFMNNPENKVLIANPSAAKEGLTLTAANNAIYLDRNFKMDDYLQSQDRIHRISQQKKCNIIKLIARDTIDEYTDEILEKKELIFKFAIGDSANLKISRSCLSKEDLLKILG
jgi:SWI/SNF-related matrix-associated actin-dependent regulator of chromatin subfamily A-like protein 1